MTTDITYCFGNNDRLCKKCLRKVSQPFDGTLFMTDPMAKRGECVLFIKKSKKRKK